MKKISSLRMTIFVAILTTLYLDAGAQTLNTRHLVKSSFSGKNYVLTISLPATYTAADSSRYPVLYVLDGNYSYNSFHSIRQVLDMGREIEDVIIVAIGDESNTYQQWLVNRHNDLTPTALAHMDVMFDKFFKLPEGTLHSGGATLFLKTLKNDIMKHIETNFKTNGDNGLSGHSLGGLFAGYCLLSEPSLFTRYGINSPSLWWDAQLLKNLHAAFAAAAPGKKTDIFISAGKLEGEMMLTPIGNFKENLTNQNNPNLMINYHVFDDETHLSVVPACSSRTLKVLYGNRPNK